MNDDIEFLKNYKTNLLYTIKAKEGEFVKLLVEDEHPLLDLEVSSRMRLAMTVFLSKRTGDVETFRLTKMKFHSKFGWQEDGHVSFSKFGLGKLKEFAEVLQSLEVEDDRSPRIDLSSLDLAGLETVLSILPRPNCPEDLRSDQFVFLERNDPEIVGNSVAKIAPFVG